MRSRGAPRHGGRSGRGGPARRRLGRPAHDHPDRDHPGHDHPSHHAGSGAVQALATAVAALLLLATLAVVSGATSSSDDALAPTGSDGADPGLAPSELLLAAARTAAEADTLRVEVEGTGRSEIRLPDRDDLLGDLPTVPGLRGALPGLSELAPHPEDLPELRSGAGDGQNGPNVGSEVVEAWRDEARRDREQLDRRLRGARESLEAALPDLPRSLTCRFSYEGSGELPIPGRLRIAGDVRTSCDPEATDARGRFRTVVELRRAVQPVPALPATLVTDGEALVELLRAADAPPEDLGRERLGRAVVRHLRFSADRAPARTAPARTAPARTAPATTAAGAEPGGGVTVDVWIDGGSMARKLEIETSASISRDGVEITWSSRQRLVLTPIG